ncbi:hypothetical protein, partial [Cetobacterium sp.]|uniref:hypothetical protein n=1 Tax=Cetobacterium sp. TaxID=2071632 RepID=UPI003F382F2B
MKDKNIEKDKLEKSIMSLTDAFDKETIENNMEIFNKIKSEFKSYRLDEKDFIFQKYEMFVMDYETVFKKAMEVPKNKKSWIYGFILTGEFKD